MLGKKTIDLDFIESLLKKDNCPLSLGSHINTVGEEKLMMMFATTEYKDEIIAFCQSLLDKHKQKDAL